MSSFAWFQDGVGYGAKELADWQSLLNPRGTLKHVFKTTNEFLASSDTVARTVTIASGNVVITGLTGGATWAWSSAVTLNVPTASSTNPRKDLVIARLTTTAVEGTNGLSIELIPGTPAATPVLPARPDNAVAVASIDVPQNSTLYTVSSTRYGGAFQDQGVLANGSVAISWNGVLPSASGFQTGFALYDIGTNQRWVRKSDSTWWTADPGPWVLCTLQNFQNGDGTNVTNTGTLYVRESSLGWEFSGRLNFSPGFTANGLIAAIATIPNGISRPAVHTYGAVAQSWASNKSGIGRIGYLTSGNLELGIDTQVDSLYVNVQLTKSPYNT